jgi:hypothetical protein
MTERVEWRGKTFDKRTAEMLAEMARESGPIYIEPWQGCYSGGVSASAGTHNGGGAVDIAAVNLTPAQRHEVVRIGRMVGFAMWLRTPAQSNWPFHIHGIAVQPGGKDDRGVLSASAHAQVIDYFNNINGLAGRGRDDGPRDHVGTTWESYNKQRDWLSMASQEDVRRIVDEAIKAAAPEIAAAVWKVKLVDPRDQAERYTGWMLRSVLNRVHSIGGS